MISATTEGIRVSVESFYLPDRSNPENQQFVFAYRLLQRTHQSDDSRDLQLAAEAFDDYLGRFCGCKIEVSGFECDF